MNLAKDIGAESLPKAMSYNGIVIGEDKRSDCFATFFEDKVKQITSTAIVDQSVYNGVRKIHANSEGFIYLFYQLSNSNLNTVHQNDLERQFPQKLSYETVLELLVLTLIFTNVNM